MNIIFGLVIIAFSIMNILFPKGMWKISEIFALKNDINDSGVRVRRFIGIAGVVIGILIILLGNK